MARLVLIRMIAFLVLTSSIVLCQQPDTRHSATSLPDAPSAQAPDRAQAFRAFLDTARLPVDTALNAEVNHKLLFDPDQFAYEAPRQRDSAALATRSALLKSNPFRSSSHATSRHTGMIGRAADAASGLLVTRDEEGRKHLNTSYLFSVATMATAHVADRPFWRRSATQPIGDFGSTIGSDAGMNVLHVFQPALTQFMKNHQPRFVSHILPHHD